MENNKNRGNRAPKGKKYSKKDKDVQNKKPESDKRLSSLNDISWYNHFPDLLEAAGRVPFAKYPGMDLKLGPVGFYTATPYSVKNIPTAAFNMPGFLEIDWAPSVGYSANNTSPISIAAKELYAKVRSKFSGSLDENGPDIIMYMVALDSVFSYIGYLKRIYRALNTYSPLNTMFPDGVLKCMGITEIEAKTLRANKTQFWGVINDLISQASKFTCPDIMDLFNRHYWMNSNVYGDAPTPRAQFYVFNQTHFYQYDEKGETGGQLTLEPVPSNHTVQDYYDFGINMIAALTGSDDAYTINGHLMRAFEGSANFTVARLEENELLDSVYVPEVLMQIHNIRTTASSIAPSTWTITQDPTTNAVLHKPSLFFGLNNATVTGNAMATADSTLLLDVNANQPTVSDVTISSRLCPAFGKVDDSTKTIEVFGGTEIVWSMSVVYYDTATSKCKSFAMSTIMCATASNIVHYQQIMQAIGRLSAFDWHPIVYVTYSGSEYTELNMWPVGDISNPTPITSDMLKDLHRVCVLSEFNAYGI